MENNSILISIIVAIIGTTFLIIYSYISNKKLEKLYKQNNEYMENIINDLKNENSFVDKKYTKEELILKIDLLKKELELFDLKNG